MSAHVRAHSASPTFVFFMVSVESFMSSDPQFTSSPLFPKTLLIRAIGVALASTSFGALAIDAAAPTTPDGDSPKKSSLQSDTELETVRVDGQEQKKPSSPKFTAPLLDTPKSVTVIPLEVIEGTASTTLIEALRTVPGITFGAGEGGNPVGDRPFIRGFDSTTDIFVDGIRDTGSQSREAFAIESIDVSKGPSSAYSGRGSAGGSINLVTKVPTTENFVAGSIGIGTDSYVRATVDTNQVISDNVAFRLNLMKHDADVPGRDGPDASRWGIAPSITFGLNQPTRVTLSYYHMETDDIPDSGIPYNNPFSSGANVALNGDGSPVHVPRDTFYGLLDRDFRKTQTDSGFVRAEHEFGNGFTLRNTTSAGRSTNDYIWTQPDDSKGNFLLNGQIWRRANTRVSSTTSASNQTDLFGEFMTGGIKHSLSTGIELSHEKNERGSYIVPTSTGNSGSAAFNPATTYTLCPVANGANQYNCTDFLNPNPHDPWTGTIVRAPNVINTRANTKSAYGFDTITLTDQWLLNLGLRYDSYSTRAITPTYVSTAGATVPAVRFGNDSSFWNYQAGIVYKPVSNGSIYLSYGTSSTPSGNNIGDGTDNLAVTNQDLDPERNKSVELGTKWDVLDNRVSLTASIFRGEKTNARVVTDGGNTELAGTQRVEGIELGISGNITEKWLAFGGYTHLKSKLVDAGFVNLGTTAAPNWQPSPNNGNQFPNTPDNSASIWTTYQILPSLTIGGGAFYMDKVYGNAANTKWVPGYTRFDAMAAYRLNEHVNFQLNVQNAGDKYYFDKAYSSHYVSVAPGRSVTLTANMKF
jgi:catecholate siderophore receptor